MDETIRTLELHETPIKKNAANDRIIILKPRGDAKDVTGMVDHRLFQGGNRLHAILEKQYGLWHLTYDSGILPQQLKQRFTSFSVLMKTVKDYYDKRNIDVVDIID